MPDRARLRDLSKYFLAGIVPSAEAGWATTSLYLALRNAFLVGAIGFNVMMAISALIEGVGHPWLLPVLALIGVATWAAWAGIVDRAPAWVSVWMTFLTSTVCSCVAGGQSSLLLFTSLWAVHLGTAMPAFLMRGWGAFATHFVGCAGYSLALTLTHPSWGATIPQGQFFAGYGIMLVLRAGLAMLAEFAARADARSAEDEQQFARLARRRLQGREVAETARVLHDTAINTLAAVATGGAAIRDPDSVRERCARDVRSVAALRDGRLASRRVDGSFASLDLAGIVVERSGLDDEALAAALDACPPAVRIALERIAYEVVQNAAKHSGAGAVSLDVRAPRGHLELTIADTGVGFDTEAAPRGGIENSVVRRAADAGLGVAIHSSPGQGTTVVLRAPDGAAPRPGLEQDQDSDVLLSVVHIVRTGAAWLWAIGVLVVGVFLEIVNVPGRLSPTYAALALGALGVGLAWSTRHFRGGWVRIVVDVTLSVIVAASFALSVATSDLARVDPALWEVLANTGTLVLLRRVGGRFALCLGLAAHVSTSVVIAVVVWPSSSAAALIVLAGAAIAAYFLAGWSRFDVAMGAIGRQLVQNQRLVLRARVEDDLRVRSEELRDSWRSAGLERVEKLLAGLATGDLDPRDERVRQACGEEEIYLRKLIQLEPELIRLMPWLLRAIGAAREQGVDLMVRTGDVEPSDEQTVDRIGATLLAAVRAAPRGTQVTVSLYQLKSGELSLILVAPHPLLRTAADVTDLAATSLTRVGASDMLEARLSL